ncbi:ankyrin repeat domain-containing protein [Shimia thalassica]|uniref:ankyrin repeat domain-containing protein n=1 Tax=Shimia thalassica TaxID=1715693 RepID=UPI0026E16503|nr:ankyrin repeat domain-containing protein [Shimia thalassica]MDO6479840.1 ankyrin repeat domain-containing protein [Shimia thalassica]
MRSFSFALVLTAISASSAFSENCNAIIAAPESYFEEVDAQHFYDCLADNPDLLDFRSSSGHTLMHLAALYATEPFVPLFLAEFGLIAGGIDDNGSTPLHFAAMRKEYVPIVATLRAIGADKEIENFEGERPYDLNDGIYPDIQALLLPEELSDELILADIKQDGSEAECDKFLTPEFFENGSPSDILYCANLSQPTASDQDGNSALHLAAQYAGDVFALDAVLISLKDHEEIEAALNARNLGGKTPLHLSAHHSEVPGMSARLVALGANVNALAKPETSWDKLRKFGTTPLHYAAYRRDQYQYFAVEELLAMGAKTLLPDRKRQLKNSDREIGRQTPLHYAVSQKGTDSETDRLTVQVLLEAEFAQSSILNPVDLALGWKAEEAKDTEGQTALHYAARSDAEPQIIFTLLDYGFNPALSDKKKQSPLLLYAMKGSKPDVMVELIDQAMLPGKTSALLGERMQRKAVCQADDSGLTALAYIRANPKLNKVDPSGASETPLSKLASICSK